VSDGIVASLTINLAFLNMPLMNEFEVVYLLDVSDGTMARATSLALYFAVTFPHFLMAGVATDPLFNYALMIIFSREGNTVSHWRCVTTLTGSQFGTVFRDNILEVAEKAGGGGHRDVFALDDLGMAACAAQLPAAASLCQMGLVVERDALDEFD